MMKIFNKKIIIIALLSIVLSLSMVSVVEARSASGGINFVPQTTIPNSEFQVGSQIVIKEDTLGKYIKAVYQYGVGLVSILAVVMIMWGGFKYIFAAGSKDRVQGAKATMISATMGLILALGSYILLYTINPDLVVLRDLVVPEPEIKLSCPAIGDKGYVRTCADFNSLDAEDIKKFDEKKSKPEICVDFVIQVSCGLPQGLCYWGSNYLEFPYTNSNGRCRSVLERDCNESGNDDPKCWFYYNKEGDSQHPAAPVNKFYCETFWDYQCSLGTKGSDCSVTTECVSGLTCVSNKCGGGQGVSGESCTQISDCGGLSVN